MSSNGQDSGQKIIIGLLIVVLVAAVGFGAYSLGKDHEQSSSDNNSNSNNSSNNVTPQKVTTDPTCNADELSLTLESSGDSGAGSLAYNLAFTNVGDRTCTLVGYPGVSLVNDNGNQIGSPAERVLNQTVDTQTLEVDTKVLAEIKVAEAGNFPSGECDSGATKIRAYPPNDTGYLSVGTDISEWCPGFEVYPVTSS